MQSQQYAYDRTLEKWLPVDISAFGDTPGGATAAKQDEAIALLTQLTQQLDFTNGVGAVQPSQIAIASSTVQEILPLSSTRKRVRITNHSSTDFILIDLNGNATTTKGQIIGVNQTWESPGREEARSRITVISGTGNNVPISYQATIDFILFFEIGQPTFTNQNANLIDINYPITIIDPTGYLLSLEVSLFEGTTDELIESQFLTTGLINGATITVTFSQVDAVEKTFYILIKTN